METKLVHWGKEYGFRIMELEHPLNPGDQIKLDFDLVAEAKGFTENNPKDRLSEKGSFIIHSSDVVRAVSCLSKVFEIPQGKV